MKKTNRVIIVESKINDVNYFKAFKKILNEQIVNDIVVTFFDSDKSKICGKIIELEKNNKRQRILFINENSSYDSIVSTLNWVADSGSNINHRDLINNSNQISFRAAY